MKACPFVSDILSAYTSDKAHYVIRRISQVLSAAVTALGEIHRQTVDGEHTCNTNIIRRFDAVIVGTAYNDRDRLALLFGSLGNSDDHLAAKALRVQLAFACDDHVGIANDLVKTNGIKDRLNAHLKP